MQFFQTEIRLEARPRGFHLVTREVVSALPNLARVRVGFLQLFLQHTSASLTINENADPDVRDDLERWANETAPDGAPFLVHLPSSSFVRRRVRIISNGSPSVAITSWLR